MKSALHLSSFYRKYLKPVSITPDEQRREFTFTILIALITGAAGATMMSSALNHLVGNAPKGTNSLPVTAVFLLISGSLWWLARRGYYRPGAYAITLLLWLASIQLMATWSFELPMAQLVGVLVIAVAGVLLSTGEAIVVTLLVAITTLVIGYLQSSLRMVADVSWMTGKLELSDAIGQAVVFVIIGGVLWLSNREIDSLFRRAQSSEAALVKERDQLEVTVAKRTQELERTQLERVLELQNFAEFGRVSANLLHDLTSPLTAATLNLEQVGEKYSPKLLEQAMASLNYVEQYVATARKQLGGNNTKQVFKVGDEVNEVIELLRHQASLAKVTLSSDSKGDGQVYGSVVDFHRVLANMLVNAMHSYEHAKRPRRTVKVNVSNKEDRVSISIIDHGTGIAANDLPHIFEDFYSTKKQVGRGLGLGLANARRVIQDDFGGSIAVASSPRSGTTFTIEIPIHEPSDSKKSSKRPRST